MRWLILFSLFSIHASAQEAQDGDYFFVLEGDTIKGHYEDFEIENGKFEQFKVLACSRSEYLQQIPELKLRSTQPEYDLHWSSIISGEFENFEPTGEWFQWLGNPSCDGAVYWKRIEYLPNDTLEVSDGYFQMKMTTDSSYVEGMYYNNYIPSWKCENLNCKVWYSEFTDTLEFQFFQMMMLIQSDQMYHKFKRLSIRSE